MSTADELVLDRPAPGVARLRLNRPARRNALTPELRQRLHGQLQHLLDDAGVRAVVLCGAGGHFCAGGDVARLAQLSPEGVAELLSAAHGLVRALVHSRKPVIAAVGGSAAGGGMGLAMACDTVLMAQDAQFVLPFHRLALVPDYGLAWTLPRRIGVARTQQLFMQPQPLPAAQALALGLADAVLPTAELDRAAVAWALRLAGQPAHTLAWIKQLMLAQQPSLAQTLALEIQAQSACIAAPEFRAGAAAFLARAGGAGRS